MSIVTADMGRKLGGGVLCPFSWGLAGSPSNTIAPGPRPASVPSGIQPFGHNRHGPKSGGCCVPFLHRVRWGSSSPKKGHGTPLFGPCLLWQNGWMDQDITWSGGNWPRRDCIRWGSISATAEHLFNVFTFFCFVIFPVFKVFFII